MRWTGLPAAVLSFSAAVVALTACGRDPRPATAEFTAGEVEVSIAASAEVVKVTFRPTRPGFHIYSLDLPPDDLGIPTRVGVRAGLKAAGAPRADKAVRWLDLPSLGARLPVYPDGPVTISLPVRRTDGRTAEVVVSYGACSSGSRLAPVIDRATTLTPPT